MSSLQAPFRPPPRSLADVRDPDGDDTYPVELLEGASSALVLFAARWHGRQDAVHVADAGLEGTCVDIDEHRLIEMSAVYPETWDFVLDDAFQYAAHFAGAERWDVVSLDPFSELFERVAELMDLWTALANSAVIVGAGWATEIFAPKGWEITTRRRRSNFDGGVYWIGLERVER